MSIRSDKQYHRPVMSIRRIAVLALTCLSAPASAQSIATIAKSGDPAPGTSGVFDEFETPVINSSGDIAFEAGVTGLRGSAGSGIWLVSNAGFNLIARTGAVAPGAGGDMFLRVRRPLLNDNGDLAFDAELSTDKLRGGKGDNALFGPTGSGLGLIARQGEAAPGTTGVFDSFLGVRLNNAGQIAFRGSLQIGVGGVDETNNVGIWLTSGPGSSPELIVREGSVAPDTDGIVYEAFSGLVLNNQGQIAFSGALDSPGVGADAGIFTHDDINGTQIVVRTGDPVDGGQPGEVYGTFGDPFINDAGDLTFRSFARTDVRGIIIDEVLMGPTGSGLGIIGREGTPAPGAPGLVYTFFDDPVLNAASGRIAFSALVDDDNRGGPTPQGIFSAQCGGSLGTVAAPGGIINVGAGDDRVVSRALFRELSGGQDGRRRAFNDSDTLAFVVFFTDNTEAICISRCFDDCNSNGVPDEDDIAFGDSFDCNCNGIPDECDVMNPDMDMNGDGYVDSCTACAGDTNCDGRVDYLDALNVLHNLGSSGPLGDVNYDGVVNILDYYIVAWNYGSVCN